MHLFSSAQYLLKVLLIFPPCPAFEFEELFRLPITITIIIITIHSAVSVISQITGQQSPNNLHVAA